MFRRLADSITGVLVPRASAGACKACYVHGSCGQGGQRICCWIGSTCRYTCGCAA
ncbi:hypothetical protein [Phytomonospora endophytica]|uniref:Uncharacterized protein n=1 Tax=Phytomonospora endophytica TaxID=714109 RepID=A0A841FTC4_9ACTN|nr:hypothetical protein [Phytomonospora endophytica]MBB6035230.1 hypothetical protein [Phytomonospora endophytica]